MWVGVSSLCSRKKKKNKKAFAMYLSQPLPQPWFLRKEIGDLANPRQHLSALAAVLHFGVPKASSTHIISLPNH